MENPEVQRKVEHSTAILDSLADQWAAEVNLPAMIKNISSVAMLRNAPKHVREDFRHRAEVQIDALVRQAYIEATYRALCGLKDEQDAMKRDH